MEIQHPDLKRVIQYLEREGKSRRVSQIASELHLNQRWLTQQLARLHNEKVVERTGPARYTLPASGKRNRIAQLMHNYTTKPSGHSLTE